MSSHFQMKCPDKVSDIPPQLSINIKKTITLPNFHDRLTPPLLQLTTGTWQTATLMDTSQSIEHVSLEDHYTA